MTQPYQTATMPYTEEESYADPRYEDRSASREGRRDDDGWDHRNNDGDRYGYDDRYDNDNNLSYDENYGDSFASTPMQRQIEPVEPVEPVEAIEPVDDGWCGDSPARQSDLCRRVPDKSNCDDNRNNDCDDYGDMDDCGDYDDSGCADMCW